MASIDWPLALPLPRAGTLNETYVAAYADDKAEVGASRRRKRFTRTLHKWSFDIVLTAAQKALLDTFRDTTTDGGVAIFNWQHPESEIVYEVRFSDLPGAKHSIGAIWTATISLDEV